MYPERFNTGIRNTTIPNPAKLFANKGNSTVFEGHVKDYDFKYQSKNFLALEKVLRENGTSLGPIAAASYCGDGGYSTNYSTRSLTRFTACSADGSLMWDKYEGNSAGGAQNMVFVAGRKLNLSQFLELNSTEQRALLSGSEMIIKLMDIKI